MTSALWQQRFVVANGVRFHCRTAGEGHPLLLLHGWPETSYAWRKVLPELASRFHVIAPDLRGFGDSGKPATGYDRRTGVRDMLALIDAFGYRRAAVVGHDWGGHTAYRMALDHPEALDRLVILSTQYFPAGFGQKIDLVQHVERWYQYFFQIRDLPEYLVGLGLERFLRHFYAHWSHDPSSFSDEDVATYARAYAQPGALRGGFSYYRATHSHDLPDWEAAQAQQITVPTLILWGQSDPISRPERAEGIERYFTDLTLKFVPECGHFMAEEKPELVIDEVGRFLGDLARRARPGAAKP